MVQITRFQGNLQRNLNVPVEQVRVDNSGSQSIKNVAGLAQTFTDTFAKVTEQNQKSLAEKNLLEMQKELNVLEQDYKLKSETADIKEQKELFDKYGSAIKGLSDKYLNDENGEGLYKRLVSGRVDLLSETAIAKGGVQATLNIQKNTVINEQRANESAAAVFDATPVANTKKQAFERNKHILKLDIGGKNIQKLVRDYNASHIKAGVFQVQNASKEEIRAMRKHLIDYRDHKEEGLIMSEHIDDNVFRAAMASLNKLEASSGQVRKSDNLRQYKEIEDGYMNGFDVVTLNQKWSALIPQLEKDGRLDLVQKMEVIRNFMPEFRELIKGRPPAVKERIISELVSTKKINGRDLTLEEFNQLQELETVMKEAIKQDEYEKQNTPFEYAQSMWGALSPEESIVKQRLIGVKFPLPMNKPTLDKFIRAARSKKPQATIANLKKNYPNQLTEISAYLTSSPEYKDLSGLGLALLAPEALTTNILRNMEPEFVENTNKLYKSRGLSDTDLRDTINDNKEFLKFRDQLNVGGESTLERGMYEVVSVEAKSLMNQGMEMKKAVSQAITQYKDSIYAPFETNLISSNADQIHINRKYLIDKKTNTSESQTNKVRQVIEAMDLATLVENGFTLEKARSIIDNAYIIEQDGILGFRYKDGRIPITKEGKVFSVDLRSLDNPETNMAYTQYNNLRNGKAQSVPVRDLNEEIKAQNRLTSLLYRDREKAYNDRLQQIEERRKRKRRRK